MSDFTTRIIPAARIVLPEAQRGPAAAPGSIVLGDPGGVGAWVVVDFGAEVFGGLRLVATKVEGAASARLRVRLGESVSDAWEGTYVDRVEEVWAGAKLDVGPTGFRFARLDVDGPGARVTVADLAASCLVRDVPRLGSFSSDDPRLDRIWEAGAETAHLCMQDLIWDGIKRGRSVWAGDLHPASHAIAAAFGPHPVIPDSLDHLRDQTTGPQGALVGWMNGIPAYSLWWLVCQADWYRWTGDLAHLRAQHAYLVQLVVAIGGDLGPDGGEAFEGWRYLDWASTRDPDAIHAGYQGLTAWALREAIGLLQALDDPAMGNLAAATLARVESHRPPATSSKQALALMVLGGLRNPEVANRDALAVDPAAGLTPFLGYHVLEARALAGDVAGGIDLIRRYWGAMLDLGSTTFWEDFDLDWVAGSGRVDAVVPEGRRDVHAGLGRNARRGLGLSLCHAWSAGPTAWLSRHVLGVRPLEPGCRVVLVRPDLGPLAHAEGTYPTPLGPIAVRHDRRPDGTIATEATAPEPIRLIAGP